MVPGHIKDIVAVHPDHAVWRSKAITHVAELDAAMSTPRNGRAPLWAITVHQPWASLIAIGEKNVENRDWHPPDGLLGSWIAIHAGKSYDRDTWLNAVTMAKRANAQPDWIRKADTWFEKSRNMTERAGKQELKRVLSDAVPYGAIVALAKIEAIVDKDSLTPETQPWFLGTFGWVLSGVTQIEPEACGGQQGLWPVQGELLMRVRDKFKCAVSASQER